jgi:quinolinate synthase
MMIDLTEAMPPGVDRFEVRKPMPRERYDSLSQDILALKRKLNAVILAHNYQVPEIQDVADFVGDSLGLSQQAAKTDADVIVFCGVHFMAETAKILNPNKTVVLPDKDAGCSLEESCPAPKLKAFQETNPNFYTIAYINCSAEVKALSDVICTSGNAVRIVNDAPKDRDLLFVPDENLGAWVMEQTGRPMTLWRGNCYVHVEWTHASISRIRREFPNAPLVAHPECTKAVRMLADEVCSTEKMVDFCKRATSRQIIIATEAGMLHRLKKECPGKEFIPAPTDNCRCNECRFMKMNTLEKLHDCMANLSPQIQLSDDILRRARLPIERMLEISARVPVSAPQG